MVSSFALRRWLLCLLAALALLGDAGLHGLLHGDHLGHLADGPEVHRGDCDHLPPMEEGDDHACLFCTVGPSWWLADGSAIEALALASVALPLPWTGRPRVERIDGPPLGPRGPPAIG